jgi:DNA polymerase-3 subunit epsilon
MLGQRSFDDLGTPLHDTTFCVLDLETTGGNRADDTITEIGVVKVRGGRCLGTFHTLVNPGRAIPPQITVLTGLTDAVVRTAPRIETVLGSLMDFLGDAVFVAHNASFDLGFVRAALARDDRPDYRPTVIDTAALARRLLRDEVPNCKLSTLASRLRLDHTPTHRALDDALATTDLLHLLLERAAGLGVLGLDDLVMLAKLAGHPQARKLAMTSSLPRTPGVYLFCGHRDEVLYVGKATNLRQRVRSYFGRDDRRRIGPMLREMQRVRHLELPDPLSAEVVESRLIARMLPRYNRAGTRCDKYCYVRLDVDTAWPRLSIVKEPSARGVHLGPLPSRTMAGLVVEALQAVLPLRRCSTRLGAAFAPAQGAAPCGAAQLGVAQCPCAGLADRRSYDAAVEAARRALDGDPAAVVEQLTARMTALAAAQRYEEAALVRDRLSALLGATRRHRLLAALRAAGRVTVRRGDTTWIVDGARLVDTSVTGELVGALPVDPPAAPPVDRPLSRHHVDEALCLAKFLDRHAHRVEVVECSGEWWFPIGVDDRIPHLTRSDGAPTSPLGVDDGRTLVIDAERLGVTVVGEGGDELVDPVRLAPHRDGRPAPGQPGRPRPRLEAGAQRVGRARDVVEAGRLVEAVLGGGPQRGHVTGRARRDEHRDATEVEHGVRARDGVGEAGARVVGRGGGRVGDPHHDRRVEREGHPHDAIGSGDHDATDERGSDIVGVVLEVGRDREDLAPDELVVEGVAALHGRGRGAPDPDGTAVAEPAAHRDR